MFLFNSGCVKWWLAVRHIVTLFWGELLMRFTKQSCDTFVKTGIESRRANQQTCLPEHSTS